MSRAKSQTFVIVKFSAIIQCLKITQVLSSCFSITMTSRLPIHWLPEPLYLVGDKFYWWWYYNYISPTVVDTIGTWSCGSWSLRDSDGCVERAACWDPYPIKDHNMQPHLVSCTSKIAVVMEGWIIITLISLLSTETSTLFLPKGNTDWHHACRTISRKISSLFSANIKLTYFDML